MRVAVTWQMCGYIDVPETKTTEEAMVKFNENPDNFALPTEANYVDGSFELSTDDVEEMEAICSV